MTVTARQTLIAIALVFGIWELTDIPDAKGFAAAFAILFLLCAAWLWRRNSAVPVALIAAMCTVEATQAHTWKDTSTLAKDFAVVAGSAGIAAAIWWTASRLHRQPATH
jgi:uncharacterized membrane protein